jgi:hypothetical protein
VSKKEKLLASLRADPPPKDFRWADLVTLLRHHEFTATCNGGSHYTFDHPSGFSFGASKTHPGGLLKAYQVKAAKDALNAIGVP